MSKKRAWQTLFCMSAIFFINQWIVKSEVRIFSDSFFLFDKMKVLFLSGVETSMKEGFPLFFYETKEKRMESFVERIGNHLTQEVFPIADYCEKYWENRDDFVAQKDEIPQYFLEADEEKEEIAHEVSLEETPVGSVTYTERQLGDFQFLMKNFYTVDSTTSVKEAEMKGNELASKDLNINFDSENPKILIYHTHGSEGFADSKSSKKAETIIGVGDKLTQILEETYGIKTYHDRNFYDTINGTLDRSKAYTYAGNGVSKILKKYPSIEVVIDLHRDAVTEGTKLVTTVNGKQTAKIMFFNGLSRTSKNGDIGYLQNPNKEDNLAFSLQMQLAAAKLYPGFTRKIYLKGYRYNLHLKPRSLLIEVGAQTNTKEEAQNAMEPLAKLLYEVLKKK